MLNILEEIYNHKLLEVRNLKKNLSLKQICQNIKNLSQPQDFFYKLAKLNSQNQTALIAEVKKASPSKGIICSDFDHIKIAKQYQQANATCISVLTDNKYFMGSYQYLQDIKQNCNLPILCKDFMVDIYQIYHARMIGADCILLIMAMIDDKKLQELEQVALDLGMSVLIEVHNQQELQRAAKLKSKLIGINNRDLKTFKVDINNSINLAKQIDKGYNIVTESGINKIDHAKLLKENGINCFLIGEYFMRKENIVNEVSNFIQNV